MRLPPCHRLRGTQFARTRLLCRTYGTGKSYEPAKLRNMALVAHIDSGKTTLTESILLKSSYISASGTVDTGSTTTDFLPVERERGITVQSASIPVRWKDWTFNLIDTPGHADFGMEVESASRVIDGAVVLIDSVEGVEPQTKGVWRQLDRYGVDTRIMFLNKLDRPGASFRNSLQSLLKHRLHPNPMALTLPVASFDPKHYVDGEPGIQGLVDLPRWTLWKWDEEGQFTCHPLPREVDRLAQTNLFLASHPLLPHLAVARTTLLENLSMVSEEFMEHLLTISGEPSSYLQVDDGIVMKHLRQAAIRNQILPVLCGSAMKHIGTDLVMDYVGELFPSPLDVSHEEQKSNAPLKMLAWKVTWDERRGWMTFVRVYSGKLTQQSTLLNTSRNQKEKASKLLLLYASDVEEVDELPYGSVGVILGLKYTKTGDTLVGAGVPEAQRATMRDITPPPAVVSASIIPQSHSEIQPVQNALDSLVRTDPSVRAETQEGQMLVHGLGALHLEIVEGRLRNEFKVNFEFGKRRVSYREGLGFNEPPAGWNVWKTEISGKPVIVTVPLTVRRLETHEQGDAVWDGNVVIDAKGRPVLAPEAIPGGGILSDVAQGIMNGLCASPHSSLPMTRVHVQIGNLKNIESRVPSVVAGAAATIMRQRFKEGGFGPLLEPFIRLKVTITENQVGKIVKDLTERGGEVLDMGDGSMLGDNLEELEGYSQNGVYIPPEWLSPSGTPAALVGQSASHVKRSVQGVAPLSQFLNYSNRLRAMSEGHGVFEMSSAGFQEVGEERKLEILREIGKA
ncbi:P-loop containing nucleoside triphosphate hydrolase protein [Crepidotus variabilis]|uniref:P-loop containing nucleoside triphosphate hydrolase protein n=1 Tax=Crepidotus variabilis TaxID=179855 RepID=A0A9P6ESH4_9AGAR|nr:P-loop containing nucleoside triphosphate hydrolase protein [Crepidotus variabilis]